MYLNKGAGFAYQPAGDNQTHNMSVVRWGHGAALWEAGRPVLRESKSNRAHQLKQIHRSDVRWLNSFKVIRGDGNNWSWFQLSGASSVSLWGRRTLQRAIFISLSILWLSRGLMRSRNFISFYFSPSICLFTQSSVCVSSLLLKCQTPPPLPPALHIQRDSRLIWVCK